MTTKDKEKIINTFTEYVTTYTPDCMNSEDGFIRDMIYGIGVAIDRDKYSYHEGYGAFIEQIKKVCTDGSKLG